MQRALYSVLTTAGIAATLKAMQIKRLET